jgi:hypothetical protein
VLDRVKLEHTFALDDLLLRRDHVPDVLGAQHAVLDDRAGQHLLGLHQREAPQSVEQRLRLGRLQLDAHLHARRQVAQNALDQRLVLAHIGHRQLDVRGGAAKRGGQRQRFADQDHRAARVGSGGGRVRQLSARTSSSSSGAAAQQVQRGDSGARDVRAELQEILRTVDRRGGPVPAQTARAAPGEEVRAESVGGHGAAAWRRARRPRFQ